MADRAQISQTETLKLRLSSAAKQTLQAAAKAARKPLNAYVQDAALSEAAQILADRPRRASVRGRRFVPLRVACPQFLFRRGGRIVCRSIKRPRLAFDQSTTSGAESHRRKEPQGRERRHKIAGHDEDPVKAANGRCC
jgi:hypothetical protein